MLWILLLTVAMQILSWVHLEGYQLADSVEFMDRARAVSNGHALDTTHAVRSFGFSTLLLPFFAIARWIGVEEMRWTVHAVRLLQMSLGLGLVYSTVRLGARIGGRQVGYVSGFLIAINPVFLQYSVDPVSGIAAAYFVATGLNLLVIRRSFILSVSGGLLMGIAFMMSYQTLMIAGPLLGLLVLRDRTRASAWTGALLGLSAALLAQVILDKITYDTWGMSVSTYFIQNGGGVAFSILYALGLEDQQWVRDAYQSSVNMSHAGAVVDTDAVRAYSLQSRTYYLENIAQTLVAPVQWLAALGLLRCFRKMSWETTILVLVLFTNVMIMSFKGAKSFRLWLPLLPLIAPLCALGWQSIARPNTVIRPRWRVGLSRAILASSLLLGILTLQHQDTARFGSYWDAMDYVNDEVEKEFQAGAEDGDVAEKVLIGAAYDWAIFSRQSRRSEVVKLRYALDNWENLEAPERAFLAEQLSTLDWFIVHGTILDLAPSLSTLLNERFEVVESFWNERTTPKIKDVRVLRRLGSGPQIPGRRARRFWELSEQPDPDAYRRDLNLDREMPSPMLLVGSGEQGRGERLMLLGFEFEPIGQSGFSWLTYHWYTDTGFDREYTLTSRISTLQCPWSSQMNHMPAHGALSTTAWPAGSVLRESYLFVPGDHGFHPERYKAIGGSYRRASQLPALLWVRGESPPPNPTLHVLAPADWSTGELLDLEEAQVAQEEFGLRTPRGYIVSGDGLLRVGKFLLPTSASARWADDGGPGPDDEEIRSALAAELQRAQIAEAAVRSLEVFSAEDPD